MSFSTQFPRGSEDISSMDSRPVLSATTVKDKILKSCLIGAEPLSPDELRGIRENPTLYEVALDTFISAARGKEGENIDRKKLLETFSTLTASIPIDLSKTRIAQNSRKEEEAQAIFVELLVKENEKKAAARAAAKALPKKKTDMPTTKVPTDLRKHTVHQQPAEQGKPLSTRILEEGKIQKPSTRPGGPGMFAQSTGMFRDPLGRRQDRQQQKPFGEEASPSGQVITPELKKPEFEEDLARSRGRFPPLTTTAIPVEKYAPAAAVTHAPSQEQKGIVISLAPSLEPEEAGVVVTSAPIQTPESILRNRAGMTRAEVLASAVPIDIPRLTGISKAATDQEKVDQTFISLAHHTNTAVTEGKLKYIENPSPFLNHRFSNISCPRDTAVVVAGGLLHANDVGGAAVVGKAVKTARAFIASQAPKSEDLGRFWQLALDRNGFSIVDLTAPKDKIEPYYPEEVSSPMTYSYDFISGGNQKTATLSITLQERKQSDPPEMRRYSVTGPITDAAGNPVINEKGEIQTQTKEIVRYHFINWPDHQTVEDMSQFKSLVDRLSSQELSGENTLVHCRAGVGRTGSLIAACLLRDMINASEDITTDNIEEKVFELVYKLRHQRGEWFVQQAVQLGLVIAYGKELLQEKAGKRETQTAPKP